MGFLPDVYQPCEACEGTGLPRDARAVRIRGKSLDQALSMTVDEALELWTEEERIHRCLRWCQAAGLGYLVLKQDRLSGGEAQRLKLASELAKAGSDVRLRPMARLSF